MSCRVQMLRANEKTKSHRHTSTSIYHAFRGAGTTLINGEPFHWQKGDSFIVPRRSRPKRWATIRFGPPTVW